MAISYSKLFVGISLPALCTGLASLLLSISANAQTIRPTTQKELKVFDPTTGNSGNIGIRAAAGTLSYTLTLPAAAPSANQVLTANAVTGGNVTLTWATPVSGTVTSVGTITSTGITGGTITSAGTLAIDTALIATRAWRQKGIDSVASLANTKVSSVSVSTPIVSSGGISPTISITQASGSVSGFLSSADWTTFNNKQNAIALATSGTSGAATLSGTTLNIPQYQAALTNPVTGTGTLNYLSKFAGTGTLTNSLIFDNGTNVGVGTASPSSTTRFEIRGTGTTSATTALEVDNASGSPMLVVKNDGSVGIGTTSPSSSLHVKNSALNFRTLTLESNDTREGTRAGILFKTRTDSPAKTAIFTEQTSTTYNQNAIIFAIKNSSDWTEVSDTDERMRIDVEGDVGIGVIAPTDKVSIAAGRLTVGFGEGKRSSLEGGNTLGSALRLYNNDVETIRLNAGVNLFSWITSGNVGIGTTSPDGKLNVVSQSGSTLTLTDNNSYVNSNSRTVSIEFKARNPNGDVTQQSASISAVLTPNDGITVPQSYLTFSTKDNSLGYREQVRIQPNGFVGIGTTSPDHKLDIEDSVNSSLITKVRNLHSSSSASSTLRVGNNTLENLLDISGWSSTYTETVARKRNGVSLEANGAGGLSISAEYGVIRLFTGGLAASNQRLTILSDGKVSVGDTDPIGRFEVKAGSDDVEVLEIEDENESTLFRVSKTGVVRIPKLGSSSNTAVRINTDGTLTTSTSDARLKKNIQVIPNALQKVMGLRGVTYNWKDGRDTTRVLGMIAQEMLKVAPELVFQNNNGYYGIHYAETTGLLVEAIKEQQKIIDQLKTEQAATGVLIRQLQLDLQAIRKLNTAPKE